MSQYNKVDPFIKITAEAFALPAEEITTKHLSIFMSRCQLISDIASLLDNGHKNAAICLMEMNDIDTETTMDLAALKDLTDQNIAMQIGVLSSQLREDD